MISQLTTIDRRYAAAATIPLTRSHLEDPGMVAIFPRAEHRPTAIALVFGQTVADAVGYGTVHGAVVDGRVVGTAAWLPPGAFPPGPRRMLASVPWLARLAVRVPRSMPAIARFAAVSSRTVREPCWYLAGLGVDPAFQGSGLGGALVRVVTDHAELPCLLHTAKPANVDFYGRFGFEVVGDWRLGRAGPRIWTMRRPALTW